MSVCLYIYIICLSVCLYNVMSYVSVYLSVRVVCVCLSVCACRVCVCLSVCACCLCLSVRIVCVCVLFARPGVHQYGIHKSSSPANLVVDRILFWLVNLVDCCFGQEKGDADLIIYNVLQ